MNKTSTLEIIQNLRRQGLDLGSLDEKQIIRIEKTLKAKIKLDQSLDINEIESIIHLLRTQAKNLELFFHKDFSSIRMIVQNDKYIFFDKESLQKINDKGEQLKPFLSEFFFDELTSYARRCIDRGHYRALFAFLQIRSILDDEILNIIRKQIEQRFLFLTETFRLYMNVSSDTNKVLPLMNPYFYRCINQLNRDAVFEDKVMNFQSFIVDKESEINSSIFLRILFSLTLYSPYGEVNKKMTKNNHEYSIYKGAHERKDRSKSAYFKGGSSTGSNVERSNNFKVVFRWIVPAIFIISILYKYNSNKQSNGDYGIPKVLKEQLDQAKKRNNAIKHSLNIKDKLLYDEYLPNNKTIQYLQFENPKIIEKEPLKLDIDYVFKTTPIKTTKVKEYLQFRNITNEHIILIMQNAKQDSTYILLRPLQMINVAFQLSKLNIYTGENLEVVTYLNEDRSRKRGLRFNGFNKKNKDLLKNTFHFKNINAEKFHNIKIIKENKGELGVRVTHNFTKHNPM